MEEKVWYSEEDDESNERESLVPSLQGDEFEKRSTFYAHQNIEFCRFVTSYIENIATQETFPKLKSFSSIRFLYLKQKINEKRYKIKLLGFSVSRSILLRVLFAYKAIVPPKIQKKLPVEKCLQIVCFELNKKIRQLKAGLLENVQSEMSVVFNAMYSVYVQIELLKKNTIHTVSLMFEGETIVRNQIEEIERDWKQSSLQNDFLIKNLERLEGLVRNQACSYTSVVNSAYGKKCKEHLSNALLFFSVHDSLNDMLYRELKRRSCTMFHEQDTVMDVYHSYFLNSNSSQYEIKKLYQSLRTIYSSYSSATLYFSYLERLTRRNNIRSAWNSIVYNRMYGCKQLISDLSEIACRQFWSRISSFISKKFLSALALTTGITITIGFLQSFVIYFWYYGNSDYMTVAMPQDYARVALPTLVSLLSLMVFLSLFQLLISAISNRLNIFLMSIYTNRRFSLIISSSAIILTAYLTMLPYINKRYSDVWLRQPDRHVKAQVLQRFDDYYIMRAKSGVDIFTSLVPVQRVVCINCKESAPYQDLLDKAACSPVKKVKKPLLWVGPFGVGDSRVPKRVAGININRYVSDFISQGYQRNDVVYKVIGMTSATGKISRNEFLANQRISSVVRKLNELGVGDRYVERLPMGNNMQRDFLGSFFINPGLSKESDVQRGVVILICNKE